MRIVSLLAGGTEGVVALGAGAELVGRSHECDFPEWVTALPVVSRPTFDVSGPSAAIDRLVRQKLRAGEPLYEVDEAALAALAPDVVVTQTHCEVCAIGPKDLDRACPVPLPRKAVASFRGGTLAGVLADLRSLAEVIGRPEAGEQLVRELRGQVEAFGRRTSGLRRPRVVCLEWLDPPFAMGNWGPELVELAGGTDALGTPGGHSRAIDWQAVVAADPDVLIVAPCGFGLARTRAELPALLARPQLHQLRAARDGQLYIADGNLYFNRSSPSLFQTVDLLAEILHPDLFPRDHEGRHYQRLPV
jgi:iron complex transport system substrate-binding protein